MLLGQLQAQKLKGLALLPSALLAQLEEPRRSLIAVRMQRERRDRGHVLDLHGDPGGHACGVRLRQQLVDAGSAVGLIRAGWTGWRKQTAHLARRARIQSFARRPRRPWKQARLQRRAQKRPIEPALLEPWSSTGRVENARPLRCTSGRPRRSVRPFLAGGPTRTPPWRRAFARRSASTDQWGPSRSWPGGCVPGFVANLPQGRILAANEE